MLLLLLLLLLLLVSLHAQLKPWLLQQQQLSSDNM